MTNSRGLVVAKYREDVSWIDPLRNQFSISIFSKDENEQGNYLKLPNIGREAHTYLTFLVEQYPNFHDVTVFCQADPFPHTKNFLDRIQEISPVMPFTDFGSLPILFLSDGRPHMRYTGESFGAFYETIFKIPAPPILFSLGNANFAVSKDRILSRPLSFYQACLEMIPKENNPIEAHFFERIWNRIFGVASLETLRNEEIAQDEIYPPRVRAILSMVKDKVDYYLVHDPKYVQPFLISIHEELPRLLRDS